HGCLGRFSRSANDSNRITHSSFSRRSTRSGKDLVIHDYQETFMNKRALVTGAGRPGGIGEAIVDRLEREGFDVVTLDKEPGCTWQVDIAVDELPDFGPIDVYVGNAAVTTLFGAAHTFDLKKWQRDLDINLT